MPPCKKNISVAHIAHRKVSSLICSKRLLFSYAHILVFPGNKDHVDFRFVNVQVTVYTTAFLNGNDGLSNRDCSFNASKLRRVIVGSDPIFSSSIIITQYQSVIAIDEHIWLEKWQLPFGSNSADRDSVAELVELLQFDKLVPVHQKGKRTPYAYEPSPLGLLARLRLHHFRSSNFNLI